MISDYVYDAFQNRNKYKQLLKRKDELRGMLRNMRWCDKMEVTALASVMSRGVVSPYFPFPIVTSTIMDLDQQLIKDAIKKIIREELRIIKIQLMGLRIIINREVSR